MIDFRLLGIFEVDGAGASAFASLGGHGRRLFEFLLSFPNRHHRRERLADLFWPELEPERARSTLSNALWRVRRALQTALPESPSPVSLAAGQRDVRLSLADENLVDAHRFARLVEGDAAERELQDAIRLYRGPFLDGEDEDWIVECRERFHCLYVKALAELMRRQAAAGRIEEALACGRRILAADPLREHVQRDMMLLYVLNGQGAQALRQFASCADLLRQECGVRPMPETSALAGSIRDGTIFDRLAALVAAAFTQASSETWPTRRPPQGA